MKKLTLASFEKQNDYTAAHYKCNFVALCAGDSIWGNTAKKRVKVSGISVVTNAYDGELFMQVNVEHDTTWEIYTDSGFEKEISEALGFAVRFTEQGMQDDYLASMEAA